VEKNGENAGLFMVNIYSCNYHTKPIEVSERWW